MATTYSMTNISLNLINGTADEIRDLHSYVALYNLTDHMFYDRSFDDAGDILEMIEDHIEDRLDRISDLLGDIFDEWTGLVYSTPRDEELEERLYKEFENGLGLCSVLKISEFETGISFIPVQMIKEFTEEFGMFSVFTDGSVQII